VGSSRYLYSDNPSYPGIFSFWVGWGSYDFGYITVVNSVFSNNYIWQYVYCFREDKYPLAGHEYWEFLEIYGEDPEIIKKASADQQIIEESRTAYRYDKDIEFIPIIVGFSSEYGMGV